MGISFNKLKIYRKQANFTQEDIAGKLGVSRQAVAKWERGETLPDIESCIKLADLYETTVDMLVRDIENGNNNNGRYFFGIAKVNDKGQITIPAECREVFKIHSGDTLLLLGDTEKGIALVNAGKNSEDIS